MLHPAQPRKGRAEFERRNVLWADCFTSLLHERPESALHYTLKWHPLFPPEYALPTLSAFFTWLQQHLSHLLPLDALMAEAEVVREAVEWTHRGAVAALQLTYLVAYYLHVLPLPRLEPQLMAATDDMRQLVGVERHYATVQAVDFAWCEPHVPAVEQLVSEWMSSPAMHTAREVWVKEREAHLSHPPYVIPPRSPAEEEGAKKAAREEAKKALPAPARRRTRSTFASSASQSLASLAFTSLPVVSVLAFTLAFIKLFFDAKDRFDDVVQHMIRVRDLFASPFKGVFELPWE